MLENDILQTLFDKVMDLLEKYNCLDLTAVYIDSTNTKAYANKKKNHKEVVKVRAKKYQKDLSLEIALKGLKDEDLTNEEYLENDGSSNVKVVLNVVSWRGISTNNMFTVTRFMKQMVHMVGEQLAMT
jgi:hypothetical protein